METDLDILNAARTRAGYVESPRHSLIEWTMRHEWTDTSPFADAVDRGSAWVTRIGSSLSLKYVEVKDGVIFTGEIGG